MIRMNEKFEAFRRMGELLELASDPSYLVPDIDRLVPIQSLDVAAYDILRTSCPYLNLPDAYAGLASLQTQLDTAYANMIASLKLHPYYCFAKLQAKMDRYQLKWNVDLENLNGYLRCAGEICTFTSTGLSGELRTNQAILDDYTSNFVNNTGGIMTETMQEKHAQINDLIESIEDLR